MAGNGFKSLTRRSDTQNATRSKTGRKQGERPFIGVEAQHETWRQLDDIQLRHERYRGFFATAHSHAEFQITLPLAGRMALVVGDQHHLIGPETIIILPPDVPHSVTYLDGELDYLLVTSPGAWLERAIASLEPDQMHPAGAGMAIGTRVVSEPFLWPLARQMAREVDAPGPGTDAWLSAALSQLAIMLARAVQQATPARSTEDPRILRAIDRILRHATDELSIEGLASHVTMSPRHFERLFKQTVGLTPKAYLVQTRLAIARNLVETSALSITDIALEVGFNHPSHFIQTFARRYGQSPGALREALKARAR